MMGPREESFEINQRNVNSLQIKRQCLSQRVSNPMLLIQVLNTMVDRALSLNSYSNRKNGNRTSIQFSFINMFEYKEKFYCYKNQILFPLGF